MPELEAAAPGKPFIYKGKTLLSGIDPIGRACKTADAVPLKDRTLFICPSPIFGYGLSHLLERIEKEEPSCAVLCIEAEPELFKIAKRNIDDSILTDNCEIEKLYALINSKWGARTFRRIEIIKFTGGYQLHSEIYDALCNALRREFAADWSNALTLTRLGRLYIKNLLRNIPLISKYVSLADLSFGSTPVLVLGAGPSLDETLDSLQITGNREPSTNPQGEVTRAQRTEKKEKQNFKIVCVDTCLGALKDRGIEPDLVVILESQHWNLRDFIGVKGWKVPAAIDLSSLPATAKILKGENYLFFTPWTQLKIFERLKSADLLPAVFPPLGSVGLSAVEIARKLTSGKIYCAGLDFSFTIDKYHARGTPGHRGKLNLQTRLLRLFNNAAFAESAIKEVSNKEQSVYTNPIMKNYRDLFEREFGKDGRIYSIEGAGSFAASTGLPLGIKTITINEFKNEIKKENCNQFSVPRCLCVNSSVINSFYESERERLEELKGILTGEIKANQERLEVLITECDFVYAHFPDCAGGVKPNINDSSFLNRVRMEIDFFLKLLVPRF